MPPKGRIRNLTNSRMLEENLDAAITVQQYRERRRASLFRLESVNQGQIQSINAIHYVPIRWYRRSHF